MTSTDRAQRSSSPPQSSERHSHESGNPSCFSSSLGNDESEEDTRFRAASARIDIAWPTVALFLAALILLGGGIAGAMQGQFPFALGFAAAVVALYVLFTVAHDASHRAVSSRRWLNEGAGRLSIYLLAPWSTFASFRFLHMQHHRHTNAPEDPDLYAGRGRFTLPLRWLTFDLYYVGYYLGRFGTRPRGERLEFVFTCGLTAALFAGAAASGHFAWIVFWLAAARVAVFFLAFGFDFLPHYPHAATAAQNPYRATSIRRGAEVLLSPLLLGQNYHLAHHLYPTQPFYRYRKLWQARQASHLAHDPAIVPAFGLRPR